MKKSYLLFIAVGLCCLDACNKEVEITEIPESPESVKMISETITASLGADTKVTIANTASDNFAWIAGDNIAVHVSNGDIHKYVLTSDDGASGASASASSASFTVVYPEGYSRDAFAVYPSTIVATTATNYGQSGSALDVTLPNEYTLEQVSGVSGTTSPCPMIASNIGSSWEFYHLCGLLRLTVNSIPPSANKITVNFHGNKVHGDFSIASPVTAGESSIVTTTGSANDEITITFDAAGDDVWRDGVDINLPLPTGEYTDITVKAFAGTSELLSVTRPVKVGAASYAIAKAAGKKCTASLPAFSVSDTKRVHIAKSNLQFTRENTSNPWSMTGEHKGTWSFLPESWSVQALPVYVDHANDTQITLFTWGTSGYFEEGKTSTYYEPWYTNDGNGKGCRAGSAFGTIGSDISLTGDYALGDWGVYACTKQGPLDDGYGASSDWRTPTAAEYLYLIAANDPSSSSPYDDESNVKRCGKWGRAVINNDDDDKRKMGIIIVPDCFVNPTTVEFVEHYRGGSGGTIYKNKFTVAEWKMMEKAGAAFLPHANCLLNSQMKDNKFSTTGGFAYWSADPEDLTHSWAFYLSGNYNQIQSNASLGRRTGSAVRLVRDLN